MHGFWPIPEDQDLLEDLLEWHDAGGQAQKNYEKSLKDFSEAFKKKKWLDAQKAYWWMARMQHCLKKPKNRSGDGFLAP